MRVTAIVPAAGRSQRMGSPTNKPFMLLQGIPIIVHTLKTLAAVEEIQHIIVVAREDEVPLMEIVVKKHQIGKVKKIIKGGNERQESVALGVQEVPENTDLILVHDGVRPLVKRELVKEAIKAGHEYGAAILAVPVKDTLKWVGADKVVHSTLPRAAIWAAQTPQVFRYDVLMEAYAKASEEKFATTDDAALVERIGHKVYLVGGSYENFKITTSEDLLLAEALLSKRRVS